MKSQNVIIETFSFVFYDGGMCYDCVGIKTGAVSITFYLTELKMIFFVILTLAEENKTIILHRVEHTTLDY